MDRVVSYVVLESFHAVRTITFPSEYLKLFGLGIRRTYHHCFRAVEMLSF
jgi:hypothetical protein